MAIPKSIGFPSMREEEGEKRAFLPDFVQWLAKMDLKIHLEKGYGQKLDFSFRDYQQGAKNIIESTREKAFQQEIVMILRSPKLTEFELLRQGSVLISMLHYHTRPKRIEKLRELGINSISLDSIANADSIRLVQNMKAVAWNGLDAAFSALQRSQKFDEEPFRVVVLGTGMVGKHAVDAATKLGNRKRNAAHMNVGGAGSLVMSVGRNYTSSKRSMEKLLSQADILVDATQRSDASQPIVPNAWLAYLSDHTVIADLVVDPYILDIDHPVVRAIEGLPQGNLDQYIYYPDDPNWDAKIPPQISIKNRRASVSCYSWPGIHPKKCMQHYAGQLRPLMQILLKKGYDDLSLGGGYFEQALVRGTLRAFLERQGDD